MAEAYHLGAKQPAAQSQIGSFYSERSDYNNAARAYLMEAMQLVMDQRSKLSSAPVAIEIRFSGIHRWNGSNLGNHQERTPGIGQ